MRLRLLLSVLALLAVSLLLPPGAAADGPATSRGAGPDGVLVPGGRERIAAVPASSGTVLAASRTDGGRVDEVEILRGHWDVPAVAYDGTAGGLSADRRTLVLMQPAKRLPRRLSRFAIVDARHFALLHTIVLERDWSFDALSPDGSTLYLTQGLGRRADRYAVRAYDMRARRLLEEPVVDPSEPDEPLRGWPVTRTTGPGGRWEYTLYAGGPETFIHALDTVHRTSICIDLPKRLAKSKRLFEFRIELRGARIAVVDRGKVVAAASRHPSEASTAGGPPWVVALVAAGGLLAAAGVRRAVRSG
jgi:hypothetical protein